MKKESASLYWTLALYLALYTFCVTARNLLPTSPALVRSNQIAMISGKADYRLSFDIVPTGIVTTDYASILHFTTGCDCCNFGLRSPAIWFVPGTTRLYYRIGDSTNGDWGFDTDGLPLNVATNVTLECNGTSVKLTVGEKVYNATQPTYRFAGNLVVYAGNPWHPAAKAVVSNLKYENLPAAEANSVPSITIQAVSVLNPDNTLHQLEISWITVGSNVTLFTVRVVGADHSVGQGCTVCTTSPCLYVHQVTHVAVNYNIFVTPINQDGTLGPQNSATFGPTSSALINVSTLSNSNVIGCSFLNNQSFYCVVCCSTDPSVPSDSSVYNISTTRGTEVTVPLQGLTSGQMYYCKAAASNTNSTRCAGPMVGYVKKYFSFVASIPYITQPSAYYQQCNDNVNSKLLPTSPVLVQSNPIAFVSGNGKADYILSFDIVPKSTIGDWGSILHFTKEGDCCNFGQRSPAIWFIPGTTRLHVRIGDSTNGDWGIDTDGLPLNVSTKVTLECNGTSVKLTVGEKIYNATQPTYRFAGNLIVYAGDPWHLAAKAVVSNLEYKILSAARVNAANYTADNNSTAYIPMASIATSTIIGITIVISFVVFFSLGVLMGTCIGCMVKKRSKVILHHTALEPPVYEMVDTDLKKITAIKVETNSAYGTAK